MSEEQELLNLKLETESTAAECSPDRSFKMRIGGTTYVVGMHYNQNSPKSFEDKVKELMDRDMQKI
ncbi:MAG: transposon-encoded TnpW family protein [Lachnospiraceae bacterium]|nr:transposon-encoded TnpW family protein [Lachnospiraceae bacterium]